MSSSQRRGDWRSVVFSLGLLGCVSTEPEPDPPGRPCVAPAPTAPLSDSVVIVTMADGDNYEVCPGIVVAGSLVATAASCLFPRVGEWLSVEQTPSCNGAAGWGPLENGDFSGWIGRSYDVDNIAVYGAIGGDTPALAVASVYRPRASSRCTDDLALAVVPIGLPEPAVPLRLDESTQVGERVTLAGLDGLNGYLVPSEATAAVGQVTAESGNDGAPPRALLLSSQVCLFARGGGVFSAETGALMGIISWGSNECDDPDGTTVAVRLAPFHRFLLEVAADVEGKPLRAEPNPRNRRTLLPCSN